MTADVNEDTMDIVWQQCSKLSKTIRVSNDLATGKSSFMKYSEAECLQLAEQFAQATGVFSACVLIAAEKSQNPALIEQYKSYQDAFTQYGLQAGRLSGEFENDDGLAEFLDEKRSTTIELLSLYRIEPMRLHDAAMQAVEDHENAGLT